MRKSARWITALAVAATFACAEAVAPQPQQASSAGKSPVSVFIDGAYIRAVPGYQSRHFEIAMGRVVAQGRAPRQFAGAPNIATGKHDIVRAAMRAQGWLPGRDVTVFSDGEVGLQSIVLSATRQPVTHILDWFHLSMRLRHIEQAWEGIRHLQNLDVYLQNVAVHVPRLRHLLWSGYVREASEAVKQMLAQLDQHPGFRDAPGKLRRLYELINNLGTYLGQNAASIVNYCRRYSRCMRRGCWLKPHERTCDPFPGGVRYARTYLLRFGAPGASPSRTECLRPLRTLRPSA